MTLRDQLTGLRDGTTPNGRTTPVRATPIEYAAMPGIEVTATVVTITPDFAGLSLTNYDCSARLLRVQKPLTRVNQCLAGAVECSRTGSIDLLSRCTIDAGGPYARITMGGIRKLCIGPVRKIISNRFLNPPTDVIRASGSTIKGGQIIRGNYIGPMWNMPRAPMPWDGLTTYSMIDVALNIDGLPYRSRNNGNLGNRPPAGEVKNDPLWELYTTRGDGPHGDAICVTQSPGDGILIEGNLIDWTRDNDGALGFGPRFAVGVNDWFRIDRGIVAGVPNTTYLGPVTVRNNMAMYGKDSLSSPAQTAQRTLEGWVGPVTVTGNFMQANERGQYFDTGGFVDVWSGNVDVWTGAEIPAPQGGTA